MAILKLSNNYRIASSQFSWELQKHGSRKHRKTGEPQETWEAIRWYSNLESALSDAAEFCLRTANTSDIHEAIQEVRNALASLGNALTHPVDEDVQAICRKVKEVSHEH